MHSIIISKSTSSLGVRTSSNIITNTTRTVAPDGYRRRWWTPKVKEPSQDHSSNEILKNLPGLSNLPSNVTM